MVTSQGSGERKWTVVLSVEAKSVLENIRTSDPAQRATIFGEIDAMSQMVRDLTGRGAGASALSPVQVQASKERSQR